MTQPSNSKWAKVIATLQASPGEWLKVAEDAPPSTIQRLKALGAEVNSDTISPRSKEQTYNRYTLFARWPTPQTTLESTELELATLSTKIKELQQDAKAADTEYNSAKQLLNRNSYRRKQAHEKLSTLLDQHDYLTSIVNQSKHAKDQSS